MGSGQKNFQGEVLALSNTVPSRSSVVNMKSMEQLCLMRLVGLANCEKRNFCYPSTPTHFLTSTDNMVCKILLFSLPLADNSVYSTPGTELCTAHEDVLCSRNCLTNPALASLLLGSDCLCFGVLVSVLENSRRNRKEPRSPVLLRLCGIT